MAESKKTPFAEAPKRSNCSEVDLGDGAYAEWALDELGIRFNVSEYKSVAFIFLTEPQAKKLFDYLGGTVFASAKKAVSSKGKNRGRPG